MSSRPFTLIHRPSVPHRFGVDVPQAYQGQSEVHALTAGLVGNKRLRASISNTYGDDLHTVSGQRRVEQIRKDLNKSGKVETVGIWDLETSIGFLPRIIGHLNRAQRRFTFFEVQASIPAGMVRSPQQWARELDLSPEDREEIDIDRHTLANEFFERSETVRNDLGLHYLAGVTPHLVASQDGDSFYLNLFSCSEDGLILASTYGLAVYAKQASIPFEAAVMYLVIAQVLVSTNPRLDFHRDTRGCLFDYNESRDSVVAAMRNPKIDPDCMRLIRPPYREAADRLINAVTKYKRKNHDS